MTPPQKLPDVRGNSAIARGFRLVFSTVNQLIVYCESLKVQPTVNAQVTRTPHGTTIVPRGTSSNTLEVSESGPNYYA